MCSKTQAIAAIITKEADGKAAEIEAHSNAEFQAEVSKIVKAEKEKVLQNMEKKTKSVLSAYAIAKSTAINKGRLEKVKARQEAMNTISKDVQVQLAKSGTDKRFVTRLIVQGALMLLEPQVEVRCRESDVQLVQSCLADASTQFTNQIQMEAAVKKECKFTVAKGNYIPANNLGGIILACQDGKITIDNTIETRLKLAIEQDKPAIRKMLFPTGTGWDGAASKGVSSRAHAAH